ncbi:MAG: hypothetical protein DRO99_02760, partial [Candidatus Aenigmatarchaeota archaeon]
MRNDLIVFGIVFFCFVIAVSTASAAEVSIYCQDSSVSGCYADDYAVVKDRDSRLIHKQGQIDDDYVIWNNNVRVNVYAGERIRNEGPGTRGYVRVRYYSNSGSLIDTIDFTNSRTYLFTQDGYIMFRSGDVAWEYSAIFLDTQSLNMDHDGDGYNGAQYGGNDCNDNNAAIHPGAVDIPGNGIDEDCSGSDAITQCTDGLDNDGDGLIDTNDPGCAGIYDSNEGDGTSQCQDGTDNDNDGATDYPYDFSCSSPQDNSESAPLSQCQDGTDNDGNGLIDTNDPGCDSRQDNDESGFMPDTNPPFVDVTMNPPDPTNSQNVLFTATANDDNSVHWVKVYVDGVKVCESYGSVCSTLRGPYSAGPHSYYATAIDESGNSATSSIYTFNVGHTPLDDDERPTVDVNHYPTSPGTDDEVTFTAAAYDNVGIDTIRIY